MFARRIGGVVLVLAMSGCGLVTVGGKPVGGGEEGTDAKTGKTAEPAEEGGREASWVGGWASTFGVVQFSQTGRKVTGEYPGGTLECDAPGLDSVCKWADATGSGRAKFHWDTASKAGGTFGNGQSDSDQGEWTLTWPAPSEGNGSTASDSVISLSLKNQCSQDFSFCVETGSNGFVQKSKVGKQSSTSYDVVPGAKVWARSGTGLNDGSCTTLLGTVEGTVGTKSTFIVCK